MSSSIYPRTFPNNLKIARRKTHELVIREAKRAINTIKESNNDIDPRLQQIIDRSIKIGVDD